MMVRIRVIRWYRMQCYDGTDSCAIVVPFRRYCHINFSFDEAKMICNNAVNIIVGKREQLVQFVGLMNSQLFDWYLKLTTEAEVQGCGIQLYVTTLEKTLIKLDFCNEFTSIIDERIHGIIDDETLNSAVFDVYKLTETERKYISECKQVTRT